MAKLVYQRKNGKWEARYPKGKNKDGKTLYGCVFGNTEEEVIERRRVLLGYDPDSILKTSEMNILILGAGSFGREVKEELEKLRIFKKIAFLDDKKTGEGILGKCTDVDLFHKNYSCAFVAIGDNKARGKYAEMLVNKHFLIPTIVSPDAIVSPKAVIGVGSMICSQGIVESATVGDFCLIQSKAVVNSGAEIESFSRLDSGAITLKNTRVPTGTWLKSGTVFGDI